MKLAVDRNFCRFLAVGILNTGLTYILYLVLLPRFGYSLSYGVAFISGIIFSYAMNSRVVFRVKTDLKSAALWPFVYLVQYFLGWGLLVLLIDEFSMSAEIAPLFITAAMLPCTFILARTIASFQQPRASRPS